MVKLPSLSVFPRPVNDTVVYLFMFWLNQNFRIIHHSLFTTSYLSSYFGSTFKIQHSSISTSADLDYVDLIVIPHLNTAMALLLVTLFLFLLANNRADTNWLDRSEFSFPRRWTIWGKKKKKTNVLCNQLEKTVKKTQNII